MKVILDWILIIISTMLFINSMNRILKYKSNTIADYVMVVIYIFNCLPVLLDNIFGIPRYFTWFANFQIALQNDFIGIIYDLYLLFVIICIFMYINHYKNKYNITIYASNKSILFNNSILPFVISLPYIHILISGKTPNYFIYGTYSKRGLSSEFYFYSTIFIYASIFASACLFFSKKRKVKDCILLIIYVLSIIWIDGKRYIVATIFMMYLFYYLNSIATRQKKISLKLLVIIVSLIFLFFYFMYALDIKKTVNNFDSLYMAYRIDFGRDDVTKFVLYRELILHEPILEYRGETVLSTILMIIPRNIWPNKPYPHYRYLTAALYGTSIYNIPAGMTPSLFEMSIANFGVILGMPISILVLLLSCYWADNCKSVPRKSMYLLIVIGLLTQSMDSMLLYFYLAPTSAVLSKFRIMKKQSIEISRDDYRRTIQ